MTADTPDNFAPSDEILMAYADDTLAPEESQRVAASVAGNAEYAARVELYRQTREVVSLAFSDRLDSSIPDRFRDLIMNGPAGVADNAGGSIEAARSRGRIVDLKRPAARGGAGQPVWAQAIAAAALVGIGLASGMLFASSSSGGGARSFAASVGAVDPTHALYNVLDGAAGDLSSGDVSGQFRLVQTVALPNGDVCREFRFSGQPSAGIGLACHEAAGWKVVALIESSSANGGSDYQPASGAAGSGMDALLDLLGASAGLEPGEEACVKAAGWRMNESCASAGTTSP